MSRSLRFANTLSTTLRSPELVQLSGQWYLLSGRFDAGSTYASITVAVPWRFQELKQHPPYAECLEPWMKTGDDWHNGPPMCWILPEEWRDAMSWRGKPVSDIIREGVEWFTNNVRCLINRHHYAHRKGLTEWLPEWDAWPHGMQAVKEYEDERRRLNQSILK